MCADPDFRSEVLAWAMRGRCPVEQGGIGNAREVERATAQVRDPMDEFQSFVSTARSAERSLHQQLDASCRFDHYVGDGLASLSDFENALRAKGCFDRHLVARMVR
jgi:hypothetical protein